MSKPMDYRNETVVLWWCGAMEPALNQGDREYNSKQPVGHRPAPRCASVGLKASESTIKALFEEEHKSLAQKRKTFIVANVLKGKQAKKKNSPKTTDRSAVGPGGVAFRFRRKRGVASDALWIYRRFAASADSYQAHEKMATKEKLSVEILGSFIHAGHGDVLGKESWGTPERIDDLYLRNPVLGDPLNVTMMGVPAMVSSVADLSSTSGFPLHGASYKSSKDKAKVDLSDSFDAAAFDENFSPSKIELPDFTTCGGFHHVFIV
ncbi:hypothetical protein Y032_0739g1959 [Ancylostoma ceylanicum]|uniref:Cdc42 binding domain-containing protein n=1 Tax=Ancylostoma ceylanicum TaxID=53326 RepID=A0A016WFU4_9BILA|nr:hypothetical protein Y032_0739g1959 [Ancylostoma ceylanicum]